VANGAGRSIRNRGCLRLTGGLLRSVAGILGGFDDTAGHVVFILPDSGAGPGFGAWFAWPGCPWHAGRASRLLASCWRSGVGCLMALVSATMSRRPGGVQCPGVRHRGASPATGRPGAPLASPAVSSVTRRVSGLPAASRGTGPGCLVALGAVAVWCHSRSGSGMV